MSEHSGQSPGGGARLLRSWAPDWAVIGIFLILAFSAIAAARAFLMPVTLALLLFFVFAPLRRSLARRGVPPAATAALVTAGLVVALGGVALMLLGPAGELIEDLPQISRQIEEKFLGLRHSVAQIESVVDRIDGLAAIGSGGGPAAPPAAEGGGVFTEVLALTPAFVGELVFTLVLLFFLIASGDLIYLKIVQSLGSMRQKRRAYEAMRQIEASLGHYLGAITLINAVLGLALATAMWAWGMPAPALFGTLGFVLNFIPYLGPIFGTLLATAVALVSFEGFLTPLLVGASYILLCALEGNFVTPFLLSRRLEVNTIVVFLAVALWAWLWSVMGMIVAVPLLVVLRVLCSYIPGLDRLGIFLGGEDPAPLAGPASAETPAGWRPRQDSNL